jgi:hypothetical protein
MRTPAAPEIDRQTTCDILPTVERKREMTKRISNFIVVLSLLASFAVIGIGFAIASQPNNASVLMQAAQAGVVAGNFVKVGTDGNIIKSTALIAVPVDANWATILVLEPR